MNWDFGAHRPVFELQFSWLVTSGIQGHLEKERYVLWKRGALG